jgi:hypothetical protein
MTSEPLKDAKLTGGSTFASCLISPYMCPMLPDSAGRGSSVSDFPDFQISSFPLGEGCGERTVDPEFRPYWVNNMEIRMSLRSNPTSRTGSVKNI